MNYYKESATVIKNSLSINPRSGGAVLLISILFFAQLSWSADLEEKQMRNDLLTIDCQNVPINKVLDDISRVTDLEINYDQELENEPVYIAFNDQMRAMDAIDRLLRGKNKVIEFNEGRQILNIRFFGTTGVPRSKTTVPVQ